MNAATTHPLAAAYLRDLELLLHGLDPGAREEVLSGVREHLTAAVGLQAPSAQVQGVLTELGSPQSIADEAYADQPSTGATAPVPSRWQAVVACALNGVGLVFLALASTWMSEPSGILYLASALLMPWAVVVALSMLSPVWTARQKATSVALGPATLVGFALLISAFLAVLGPSPVNAIPAVAIFGASAWILVRLGRVVMR